MASSPTTTHRLGLAGAALVAVTLVASSAVASSASTGAPHRTVASSSSGAVTDVTVTASARTLDWPQRVTVEGLATQADGSPAASVSVELWAKQVNTSYFRVSSFTTDSQGRLFASRLPESKTSYQWRMPTSTVASSLRSVKVRPALTIKVSSTRVVRGSKFIVSGAASPTRFHGPIRLQRKGAAGWATVARSRFTRGVTTLEPSATYRFGVLANTLGKRVYRTLIPADSGRLRAVSTVVRVRVVR